MFFISVSLVIFCLLFSFVDYVPVNPETPIQNNLCTPLFTAAQFTMATCWKQPKCPSVNEWIKKLWYIYTMEYCAAERKKELLPSVTAWMEQGVRDKYHMISPISGI